MDDEAEIGFFLLEPRPRLKLLPDTIDIEADDLLEAKKVNRELLPRRKLRPVLRDFDIIIIDAPPAMRTTGTLNGLAVADPVVIPGRRQQSFRPARAQPTVTNRRGTGPRCWIPTNNRQPITPFTFCPSQYSLIGKGSC